MCSVGKFWQWLLLFSFNKFVVFYFISIDIRSMICSALCNSGLSLDSPFDKLLQWCINTELGNHLPLPQFRTDSQNRVPPVQPCFPSHEFALGGKGCLTEIICELVFSSWWVLSSWSSLLLGCKHMFMPHKILYLKAKPRQLIVTSPIKMYTFLGCVNDFVLDLKFSVRTERFIFLITPRSRDAKWNPVMLSSGF